ncbi:3-dehydroquinate synthase [Roseibium denhamense]|uniref:3-dehydroquinate synthase n=1 Tax=Roseibium denhamense TaxID=76305 RepID=A0ABY1PAA8_9HYPH|nr:3-dehydroquinate synthase [Roseibium denhamense]MTI07318.1 3-dehydroquinate synthase [Roseibium denhamense]SMP28772.1 3-dehydroquinate synthase [Roseibium denhamense]
MADTLVAEQAANRTTVQVDLGSRSYPIKIGRSLLAEAGAEIANVLPGARLAVVTDETVARFHLDALRTSLDAASLDHTVITVPPGESTKCYAEFERVCDEVLAARLERGDAVVALGGGVVGDLTGYVAASVRRGMVFVQLPTTLLAQVDSSVGGKTGINSRHGKNLIGAFHQPALVLADTGILDTLPMRDFRAGYAEVVKYGLLGDAAFFAWLEDNWQAIFSGGPEREEAVARSCQAKADVVAADELESGRRALLNLGHTFGHALEAAVSYETSRLVHGEGVSIGMMLAHEFSERLGLIGPETVERVHKHLSDAGLPVKIQDIPGQLPPAETFLDIIAQDKKVTRGALTFILTRGIGEAFVEKGVEPALVTDFLKEKLVP